MKIALLHGFAGAPESWHEVIAAWPRGATDELVAIALPGHGGVPVADSWDANLDAVATAVAATGAELVIGYSLGARLALGLLATARAPRAILIGVNPGLPADDAAARDARRAEDARWAALLRDKGIAAFVKAWEAQPLFASQAKVPAERLEARRAIRMALDPEQLARAIETMGLGVMPDYRAESVRAGLVVGDDDPKFAAIAQGLGVPYRAVVGSGHDPTLEQPKALAELLAIML